MFNKKNNTPPPEDKPERRIYKRIKKHFILSYFELTNPEIRYDASQLKNISLGGMCFVTAKPFPRGALLGIELKTPFMADLTHLEGSVLAQLIADTVPVRAKIQEPVHMFRFRHRFVAACLQP